MDCCSLLEELQKLGECEWSKWVGNSSQWCIGVHKALTLNESEAERLLRRKVAIRETTGGMELRANYLLYCWLNGM